MRNKPRDSSLTVLAILLAFGIGVTVRSYVSAPTVRADTTSSVQGIIPTGSAVPSRPVYIGGKDTNGNVQPLALTPAGNVTTVGAVGTGGSSSQPPFVVAGVDAAQTVQVFGVSAVNSTAAPNAAQVAGIDSAGLTRVPLMDKAGASYIAAIQPGVDAETIIPVTSSNGVTSVAIQAASGTKTTYVGALFFINVGTVTHTVRLVSAQSGTIVTQFILAASGNGVIGENGGIFRTLAGEGLSFFIDGTGAVGDVSVSGVVVQK